MFNENYFNAGKKNPSPKHIINEFTLNVHEPNIKTNKHKLATMASG